MKDTSIIEAIMTGFAEGTGLATPPRTPRRYLWTDAFAVCNFLELFRQTVKEQYQQDAKCLVSQIHRVLGRHRENDSRLGWISGLDEQEGEQHPENFSNQHQLHARLSGLARFLPLIEVIESFWLEPISQQSNSWTGHRDINSVMLATSLAPNGYLVLQ